MSLLSISQIIHNMHDAVVVSKQDCANKEEIEEKILKVFSKNIWEHVVFPREVFEELFNDVYTIYGNLEQILGTVPSTVKEILNLLKDRVKIACKDSTYRKDLLENGKITLNQVEGGFELVFSDMLAESLDLDDIEEIIQQIPLKQREEIKQCRFGRCTEKRFVILCVHYFPNIDQKWFLSLSWAHLEKIALLFDPLEYTVENTSFRIVDVLRDLYYKEMQEKEFFLLFFAIMKMQKKEYAIVADWIQGLSLEKKEQCSIFSILGLFPDRIKEGIFLKIQQIESFDAENVQNYILDIGLGELNLLIAEEDREYMTYLITDLQVYMNRGQIQYGLAIIHRICQLPQESIVGVLNELLGLCNKLSTIKQIYYNLQALLRIEEHKRNDVLRDVSMLCANRGFTSIDLLIEAYKGLEEGVRYSLTRFFQKNSSSKLLDKGILLFAEVARSLDQKPMVFLINVFIEMFLSEKNLGSSFFDILSTHIDDQEALLLLLQSIQSIKKRKDREEIIQIVASIWPYIEEKRVDTVVHFLNCLSSSVRQDLLKIKEFSEKPLDVVSTLCSIVSQSLVDRDQQELFLSKLNTLFQGIGVWKGTAEIFNALYRVFVQERLFVVEYINTISDSSMSGSDRAILMQRIDEIPLEERKSIIETFPELSTIPSVCDKGFLITALHWLSKKVDGSGFQKIKRVLANEPAAIKQHLIITMLEVLYEKHTDIASNNREIREEFTEGVIQVLSSLIDHSMDIVAIVQLLENVKEVPKIRREEILADVLCIYGDRKEPQKDVLVVFLNAMEDSFRKKLMTHIGALETDSDEIFVDFVETIKMVSELPHDRKKVFGECIASRLENKNKPLSWFVKLFSSIKLENSHVTTIKECLNYFQHLIGISEGLIEDIASLLYTREIGLTDLYVLLVEISSIPANECHYMLQQVKRVFHQAIEGKEIVFLIRAIKQFSRADCESVVRNVKKLITGNNFDIELHHTWTLIDIFRRIYSHEERASLTDYVLELTKVPTSMQDKMDLVFSLVRVYQYSRNDLVQDVKTFCGSMNVFRKSHILQAMSHIEEKLRRELIEQTRCLFRADTISGVVVFDLFIMLSKINEEERVFFIQRLKSIIEERGISDISVLFSIVRKIFPVPASVLLYFFPEELLTYDVFERVAKATESDTLKKYQTAIITSLEAKLSDNTVFWADFIVCNYGAMDLSIDHLIVQRSIAIQSAHSVLGWKNPSKVYKHLLEGVSDPINFLPSPRIFQNTPIQIELKMLSKMTKSFHVERKDFFSLITRSDLNSFIYALKKKVDDDLENAEIALGYLGTSWAEISYPLFYDPENHLTTLLRTEGVVSEQEAQWRAVLQSILGISNAVRHGMFFTEQEESFIKTIMGIQHCRGGKDTGISFAYSLLDKKYHYPVSFEQPNSPDEAYAFEKRNEAIRFVEDVIQKNIGSIVDSWTKILIEHTNQDTRESSSTLLPIIGEDQFWDHDRDYTEYHLNQLGAKVVLQEVAKKNMSPFVIEILRLFLRRECDGTGKFVQNFLQEQVAQPVHQGIYLQNFIGHIIGTAKEVIFDPYTGVLHSLWEHKTREEVLKALFDYITIDSILDALIKGLQADTPEKRLFIEILLGKELSHVKLTQQEAFVILEKMGYMTRLD